MKVRIKLFHSNSLEILQDILADFPAQVIFSRVGLLQTILDVVGSTHIRDDIENHHYSLNSISAIDWLRQLFQKAIKSFENLYEGNLVCELPDVPELSSKMLSDETSNESSYSPSLAYQMVT